MSLWDILTLQRCFLAKYANFALKSMRFNLLV